MTKNIGIKNNTSTESRSKPNSHNLAGVTENNENSRYFGSHSLRSQNNTQNLNILSNLRGFCRVEEDSKRPVLVKSGREKQDILNDMFKVPYSTADATLILGIFHGKKPEAGLEDKIKNAVENLRKLNVNTGWFFKSEENNESTTSAQLAVNAFLKIASNDSDFELNANGGGLFRTTNKYTIQYNNTLKFNNFKSFVGECRLAQKALYSDWSKKVQELKCRPKNSYLGSKLPRITEFFTSYRPALIHNPKVA